MDDKKFNPVEGLHAAILAEKEYEDLELWYPKLRLQESGMLVSVVAPQTGTYKSKHGYPVEADAEVSKVEASKFEVVIIPGGYAPDHMRRHQAMVDFVRRIADNGKVVAAICHGGWMLASAGLVKGKRVTGFFSIQDDLKNAGAHFEDAPVVKDGNIITSRTPADLPFFCAAVLEAVGQAKMHIHA